MSGQIPKPHLDLATEETNSKKNYKRNGRDEQAILHDILPGFMQDEGCKLPHCG